MISFLDAPSWLIPMSYSAFVALTRNGVADVCLQECFPSVDLPPAGQDMLMRCLPNYEQDYQVLILEVGPGKVYPCGLQLKRHVEVGEIKAVIPVSAQAHTDLQRMLPAIPWARPLFEAAFQEEDARRQMECARMGGKALLSLLGIPTESAEVRQRCLQIEAALARRKGAPPNNFLERLLKVARSGPVFKSDVDYINDVGSVMNVSSNLTLESLGKRALEHSGGEPGLGQLLRLLADLRDSLSGLTDTWYPSSLIFLKLKNEIEYSGGRYQGLSSWALELQKLEPAAFTEAALLTGYHFKFQAFGASYWTHTVGSTSPEPAPVQRGLVVKEPTIPRALPGQLEALPTETNQEIIRQWLTYAAGLGRQGRFDEAIRALQRVVEEDPRNLEVRHALIKCAIQKGDFETVVYQHMDCAELHTLKGDTNSALEHYETILGMEETVLAKRADLTQSQLVAVVKPEIYLRIGEFRLLKGDADQAMQILAKSQELKPGIWETHMALGQCLMLKHMYQEAMDQFRQVLRLAEADDQQVQDRAYEMLSLALRQQGDSPD